MSVQILGKGKKVALKRRHARLRKHISGTPELPRLVVTRSNRHMVAQIIDDTKGVTLVSESTLTSDFAGFEGTKTEAAKKVGELIAKKAQDAGITAVVFDRGGNKYHGRVAAVAEGAREGGLPLGETTKRKPKWLKKLRTLRLPLSPTTRTASPVVASAVRVVVASVATVVRNLTRTRCSIAW